MHVVENKMAYVEKQLYLRKLYKQTTLISNQPQDAPRRQQITQHSDVAPISRRIQQPFMNPYFNLSRHLHHILNTMQQLINFNQHDHHLNLMLQYNHQYNLHNPFYPLHSLNHHHTELSLLNQLKPLNCLKR